MTQSPKRYALYCTLWYCAVLYCTVLYCTVLYCTVLYCPRLMLMLELSGIWYRLCCPLSSSLLFNHIAYYSVYRQSYTVYRIPYTTLVSSTITLMLISLFIPIPFCLCCECRCFGIHQRTYWEQRLNPCTALTWPSVLPYRYMTDWLNVSSFLPFSILSSFLPFFLCSASYYRILS